MERHDATLDRIAALAAFATNILEVVKASGLLKPARRRRYVRRDTAPRARVEPARPKPIVRPRPPIAESA